MIAKAKRTKRPKHLKKLAASKSRRRASKKVVAKTSLKKKTSTKSTKSVSRSPKKQAKRKPQEKTAWKISPEKHATQDVWVFKKNRVTIVLRQNYRFPYIIVAQKPNLTKYDPDKGVNIDKFGDHHYEPGDDSYGPDWTFPDDFPSEEQERIKSLWDEEHDNGMFAEGWISDVNCYFFGPLSVEEVKAEDPFEPI